MSCSRYPADVEWALRLVENNRTELEKVLIHYSQREEDKLKLKSAYFLISNMPYHYTVRDPQLEAFKEYLDERVISDRSWIDFQKLKNWHTGKIKFEPDILHITSAYLIRNIDFSFQVWRESPWEKHISFETFCEELLPYRISFEPLQYWKEDYYAVFKPIIDSLMKRAVLAAEAGMPLLQADTMEHGIRLDEICRNLLEELKKKEWTWGLELQLSGFGPLMLLQKRYGTCQEVAEFVAYVLRSLGIPSGIDQTIQQPDQIVNSHFWNYIHTLDGNLFGFQMDGNYLDNGRWKMRKNGKIYRRCFALQKESLPEKYKDIYIPEGGLQDNFLRDVSFEYCPDTHVSVQLNSSIRFGRKDLAYLCVFNNREWIPVAWSKPKRRIVEFRHVEPDILYHVRLINATRNVAVTRPFVFHSNNHIQFLDADSDNYQTLTLNRKYRLPLVLPWYHRHSEGGLFQGANRPDFADSVTLHKIPTPSGFNWMNVKVDDPRKYRFVRFLASETGEYNGMAEAEFYSEGMKLTGEVIGTDSSAKTFPNDTKFAVFDGDPLTFFDAFRLKAWAGLRFDKPYRIDAIRYIYRNDDNNVRKGDRYELFYMRNGEWQSAGMQTADTTFLLYEKAPSNTLFWLRNLTRGREERPFIIVDGKQFFY